MNLAVKTEQVNITLPDGKTQTHPAGVTGEQIALAIGAGLAKAALAIRVNGELWDLTRGIESDANIAIITSKDAEGLELIRHDAAHIMAEAVKELFPDVQVTIGPAIDNGFFYDYARKQPFTPEDLITIENKMKEIVARNEKVIREVWDRNEAIKFFQSIGEQYKAEIIQDIPEDQAITLYRHGNFIDLCRGPHAPSTGKMGGAFKLTKISGAYWRGDHRNEMLQRIYGTAWPDKASLENYLKQLEEAEKRDHRRIGRELDLFHVQEEAVGQVFWHDKGWTLYRTLEQFIRKNLRKSGYIEVRTPVLVDSILWQKSGHWEKFREHMFTAESEEKVLAMKPMNCPCHVQIFKQGQKSYRDLPLRMAEFGMCHRNEPSGAMHGLMRVRGFVQDDAHIFCTEDQITSETIAFCELLKKIYSSLGFTEVKVRFSDRPPVRAGEDSTWDKAESSLKAAIEAAGLEYTLNPGEGAFYGPKIEFVLRDAIGRDWQCGTLQVDFVLPERLDAEYIGPDNAKHRPVMLHRAILGSFERFIGILIEQYSGKFPLWLAPLQVVVTNITNDTDAYAKKVYDALIHAGIRAEIDLRAEKINYKIREHSLNKVPVLLVVGAKEEQSGQVAMRRLGVEQQETLALDTALAKLAEMCAIPE